MRKQSDSEQTRKKKQSQKNSKARHAYCAGTQSNSEQAHAKEYNFVALRNIQYGQRSLRGLTSRLRVIKGCSLNAFST